MIIGIPIILTELAFLRKASIKKASPARLTNASGSILLHLILY